MSFDQNSWYTFASVESNNTRSLHWCTQQIVCNSDQNITGVNASWQIVTRDTQPNSATTYTLRNRGLGPDSALTVTLGTYQGNPETQPGFAPRDDGDPRQQWDLVRKGQNSGQNIWFIQNIANGTNYNFAEHGEGVYMTPGAQEPGLFTTNQTWIITELGSINDDAWAPVPSLVPNGTSNATIDGAANQNHSGHSMSAGDIAGAVVGTVLGFALVILAITWVFRWRRRRITRAELDETVPESATSRWTTLDSRASDSPQEEKIAGLAHEMPVKQSESSFERSELEERVRTVTGNSNGGLVELDATKPPGYVRKTSEV